MDIIQSPHPHLFFSAGSSLNNSPTNEPSELQHVPEGMVLSPSILGTKLRQAEHGSGAPERNTLWVT
jgi:hypothetical protein